VHFHQEKNAESGGLTCIAFGPSSRIFYVNIDGSDSEPLGEIMEWTSPVFEEVCLNCEINSYASAKLQ
jgi:hypothetical protein